MAGLFVLGAGLVAGLTGLVVVWFRPRPVSRWSERSRLVNPHRRGRFAGRGPGGRV